MARALPQNQSADNDHSPGEWQSLRHELVALLDQVDSRVARVRSNPPDDLRQPPRYAAIDDSRMGTRPAPAGDDTDLRHRDALKSVQRAISRFDHFEAAAKQPMPPNPRD